jgi:predicted Zn-dependent protease
MGKHKKNNLCRSKKTIKHINMKKILTLILLFAILSACKTVPITGRKQFVGIPAPMMNSLSVSAYNDVRASSTISSNAQQTAMVKNSGQRISKAVEEFLRENKMESRIKEFNWEFILIKDPTVNAWCMPGGRIAFYEGIMPICANETGVAVVMAHEIAHAVANHSNERMSWGLVQQLGGLSLAVALSEKPEATQALALTAFGVGSALFGTLPHSRRNEYEADKLGMVFMAMAGYDPAEAAVFWERMMALSGNKSTSDFLSTHPANKKRIAENRKNVPFAMKYYKPHAGSSSTTTTQKSRGIRR